ncbi:MAG: preprotein translocase subunit Sec61beta [Candidatus Anstonellales archaeon]
MSVSRTTIGTPPSSAGILGISANEDMGGIKFEPGAVVIFTAVFILLVKIVDYLVR